MTIDREKKLKELLRIGFSQTSADKIVEALIKGKSTNPKYHDNSESTDIPKSD